MTTGNNIKRTRLQKGLTQTQLAQKIGKSTGYVCAVEQGRLLLTAERCSTFAVALGVQTEEILGCDIKGNVIAITPEMTTGQRIRAYRANLGLTQAELAKKMGYRTWAFISNIERDMEFVTKSKLHLLAKALGVTPSDITDINAVAHRPFRTPVIIEGMTQGEKLREYRCCKGMTQRELSRALGFNHAAFVSGIENGKYRIPVKRIDHIAAILGISPDNLV